MTRFFRVADHLFGISFPEDSRLWELLDQYSPFEVKSGDTGDAEYSDGTGSARDAGDTGGTGNSGDSGNFIEAGNPAALSYGDAVHPGSTVDSDNSGDAVHSGDAARPLFILSEADELPQGDWEIMLDQPAKDGEPVVRVLHSENGWLFEVSPNNNIPICAHIWMPEDFGEVLIKFDSIGRNKMLFAVNNALMLAFAMSTTKLGTLEMHASMVSNGGRAYLFIAPSGTGKSTHSSLWLNHIPGSELMNDDNPILRILPDGRVMAYGSPWSGKTPCYRNVRAEVGAIVRIRQCRENAITRLPMPSAFAEIYSSCSGMKCNAQLSDALCDSISAAVCAVPCYVLDCRPDKEAALVCAAELLRANERLCARLRDGQGGGAGLLGRTAPSE